MLNRSQDGLGEGILAYFLMVRRHLSVIAECRRNSHRPGVVPIHIPRGQPSVDPSPAVVSPGPYLLGTIPDSQLPIPILSDLGTVLEGPSKMGLQGTHTGTA